jgi:hypothetical protein
VSEEVRRILLVECGTSFFDFALSLVLRNSPVSFLLDAEKQYVGCTTHDPQVWKPCKRLFSSGGTERSDSRSQATISVSVSPQVFAITHATLELSFSSLRQSTAVAHSLE